MSITMPYIVPLFLGMTFDARTSTPGLDIFDSKYVDDPKVLEFGILETNSKVATSLSEVRDVLDVSGELSLKIKAGMIKVGGKGSYLKKEQDFSNKVEILTVTTYTSKIKTFKPERVPRPNWWEEHNENVLGTHYVDSITYGAELIASATFTLFDKSDKDEIKATIEAELITKSDSVNVFLNGSADILAGNLSTKANLEISYYATVPLKSVPSTLQGLETLIQEFGEQVNNMTDDGVPLKVELFPLTDFAPPEEISRFEFERNKGLEYALFDLEQKFDDLRKARTTFATWTKGLPANLPFDVKNQIGGFYRELNRLSELFYVTVATMDFTQGPEQLLTAFDAYNNIQDGLSERYFEREVENLKFELGPKIPKPEVTGYTYIQWGNCNCTAPGTTLLYHGFVFSSSEEGRGGTSKYDCAPIRTASTQNDYKLNDELEPSTLGAARYTKINKKSNPLKGSYAKKVSGQGIPCAKCLSPDSPSVFMLPGFDTCPLKKELMYSGYLASSRNHDGFTTEYICLDAEPSPPYEMDPRGDSENSLAFTVVKSQGSLPDFYGEGNMIKCVVCSV